MYSPTFYLSNGHLQTLYYAIYHAIATPVHLYPYKRELLHLSDGGQIALDWIMDPTLKLQIDTPVLAVIPGLTGCLDDCYIRSLVEEGTKRGFKCVVVNHRGCGNTPLTSRNRSSLIYL